MRTGCLFFRRSLAALSRLTERGTAALGFEAARCGIGLAQLLLSPAHGWPWAMVWLAGGLVGLVGLIMLGLLRRPHHSPR